MTSPKTTTVAVREEKQEIKTADNSVESFISQAIASGAPIETLERIFTLREKVKAEQAKEAFLLALSGFQGECPVIKKTKKVLNKDKTTVRYIFAPLDSIVEQISKPLAKYRLAYTWDVRKDKELVKVTVTVTHSMGHSQTSEFETPIDSEAYMNAPQKVAAAMTFGKRQTLCNALGISTGDEDLDANDLNREAPEPMNIKARIMMNLKYLGQSIKDKAVIEEAVKRLTKLDLTDENEPEIESRLKVLIDEKNEDR